MPDFLVIGAQRAGTSSLYKYLGRHPLVAPSLRKETEYFSRRYGEGLSWYRAHFPLTLASRHVRCFEATPDYLYWPTAPARASEVVPDCRFIVLLRDPIERAFSHYKHMVRLGFESWPIGKAILLEEERIAEDRMELGRNELHYARPYLRFSYCSRGLYAEQLRRWFAVFPRERFWVGFSEDLFRSPRETYDQILRFLDLPTTGRESFLNHSYRGPRPDGPPLDDDTRRLLTDRFAGPDAELVELLGREVPWSR